MAAVRTATVTWQGSLAEGSGSVSAGTSGLAAHAACFAMAFSADLGRAGYTPEELHVEAEVIFDKLESGWTVTRSAITVLGHVHGITPDEFDRIAEGTRDGCPISRALAGNVELSVDATLETDG
jgi:osmotically inducible protein OsmC